MCGQSPEDREDTLTRMQALLQASGFPHHLIHLEEVGGSDGTWPSWGQGLMGSTRGWHTWD